MVFYGLVQQMDFLSASPFKGKPQRLFISDQNTLGNILCISEDKRRNLWIGTTNGVFRIDFEINLCHTLCLT